jgi:hypothetical protein
VRGVCTGPKKKKKKIKTKRYFSFLSFLLSFSLWIELWIQSEKELQSLAIAISMIGGGHTLRQAHAQPALSHAKTNSSPITAKGPKTLINKGKNTFMVMSNARATNHHPTLQQLR